MPSKARQTLRTNKKKKAFLDLIAAGNTVGEACRRVGISRPHIYELKNSDPEFNAAWDQADDEKREVFEQELARRALGYSEPLTYKGLLTGDTVTRHSDILLMFLMKKLDPTYRDNARIEVNIGDRLNELADAIQGKPEDPKPDPKGE